MNRKAVVAGQFYKSGFNELDKQIRECFTNKFGPGELPIKRGNKRIYGVIVPHAGYMFSGMCAAWAYKEIAESRFPEVFVVLGTNHTGLGSELSTYLFADWETPFGVVKVDKECGYRLVDKVRELNNEPMAHMNEHSIEVQLPFLQFVNKDRINELRIVPIVVGFNEYEIYKKLGKAIADLNKNICVIASSDFTHYGINYSYVPFIDNIKENMYKLDKGAIEFINKLDTKGFLEYKHSKDMTICGAGAIATVIETVRNLGVKGGRLLSYYTSGDIINDYKSAVGYASILFN